MCGEIMTGNSFLKRLMFQLDFLSPEDVKTVLSFYESKIALADTLTEEEEIVRSFGSPEHIAKKLKEAFDRQRAEKDSLANDAVSEEATESASLDPAEENGKDIKVDIHEDDADPLDEGEVEEAAILENADDAPQPSDEGVEISESVDTAPEEEEDLIFSKPVTVEKAPEIVHSLENKEIKSLYGEKVVIEEKEEPVEEIVLEPIDDENGLTAEEIEQAKADTLEKAKNYTTTTIELPTMPESIEEDVVEDESLIEGKEEPEIKENVVVVEDEKAEVEEEEKEREIYSLDEEDEGEDVEKERVAGLFNRLFPATKLGNSASLTLKVLLSIIISPLLLIVFGAGIVTYLALTGVVVIVSALLALLMIALVLLGIVELVYGFAMLFDTVSVALIEIGVGTVLFALVTAAFAMIYELIMGVVPKTLKKFTHLMKRYFVHVRTYLYGGQV